MKSFAALALMAAAACAVDIEVDQYTKNAFMAPASASAVLNDDDEINDDGTVKVNVWDTIDAELMELMNEVTALMTAVDAQGQTLMTTQVSFEDLMSSVADLRTTNAENSSAIATQKAIDASQDAKLAVLNGDVTKLEHKVSELQNKVAILKLRVADLPDLSGLTDRLLAIIEKNMQLMMDVMTQAEDIQEVTDKVVDVNLTLDMVEADRMEVEMALDQVKIDNEANDVLITTNTSNINDVLLPTIMNQLITADYIEVNAQQIMLMDAANMVGTFTLCGLETLDFHLAMSDEPGINDTMFSTDNKVTSISLLEDGTEVATSNVTDTIVRGHQHTLFYKFTNPTSDSIVYTIVVNADIGDVAADPATIEQTNLQWGYKTYGDGYVLDVNPTDSMC